MRLNNKRGLSPVVATVLLVALALILAVIVFLWAKGFISEKVQKFDQAIQYSCDRISFDAEATSSTLSIVNRGDVALFGVKVKRVDAGSVEELDYGINQNDATIMPGETKEFDWASLGVVSGDSLIVLPSILGEANSGRKSYTCGDDYGKQIVVL